MKERIIRCRFYVGRWKSVQAGIMRFGKRLSEPPKPKRKLLGQLVRNCYFENRRRYGVRRITASLNKEGVKIGKHKVRR